MSQKKGTEHFNQVSRLNRISGQIRGITKMVEEQRYCNDILIQIRAVKAALSAIEVNVIEQHMNKCLGEAVKANDQEESKIILQEVIDLLKSSLK